MLQAFELAFLGQGDEVERGDVASLVAAYADAGLGGGDEALYSLIAFLGRDDGDRLYGQAIYLILIEHRIGAQHSDLLLLLGLTVFDRELLGEDNGGGLLAFAHLAA